MRLVLCWFYLNFFFAPAASLYLYVIGYFLLCLPRSYSILILGQCFSASSLYYFNLSFFCCVYSEPAQWWYYINVFSLLASLWCGNFGSNFFMFWRHCPVLILAQCYSCLCQAFVIVILAFFFCTCWDPLLSCTIEIFVHFLFFSYRVYTMVILSQLFSCLWPTWWYNIMILAHCSNF